jgi:hypothetical protein
VAKTTIRFISLLKKKILVPSISTFPEFFLHFCTVIVRLSKDVATFKRKKVPLRPDDSMWDTGSNAYLVSKINAINAGWDFLFILYSCCCGKRAV